LDTIDKDPTKHFPFCECDTGRKGAICEVLKVDTVYTMAWIVGLGVLLVLGLGCGGLYSVLSRRGGGGGRGNSHNAFFDPIAQGGGGRKPKVFVNDWL
jgi:hypothetical protein